MLKIACFCFSIAVATPLLAQVQPSASGGPTNLDDSRMMTPPPVSGGAYPGTVGSEERSNFIRAGLVVTGSYNDNILPGSGTQKVGDAIYSIVPTISLDRRAPRESLELTYGSGFTLYQKTTQLNGVTQNGSAEFRLNLSRYAVVEVRDSFNQNNNLYNQANPFGSTGISAGSPSASSVYVYPYENMLGNTFSGGVEYQYGRNAMIGAGGNYSLLHYSATSNEPSLSDSNTGGGSAFWSRRVSRGQYLGLIYEYSRISTNPVQTTTDTNTISVFYTRYLSSTISLSVLGGPQHYDSVDPSTSTSAAAWTPAVRGSVGYQTTRTSFAVDYSRVVSGAGGLIGAYHSNTAGIEARRKLSPSWSIGASGGYALFKNVTPTISAINPGGHTIFGTAHVERSFHDRFNVEVGYSHFHQTYDNFGTLAQLFPDSNREYASVNYQFSRPLGR
jgi:hypothetical protein